MDGEVIVAVIAAALSAAAIGISIRQAFLARAAARATNFQFVYTHFMREETYQALVMTHRLRRMWAHSKTADDRRRLAEEWVCENRPKDDNLGTKEWLLRRSISQYLARCYNLLEENYIDDNDLFRVIPELPALFSVLVPIEAAVLDTFDDAVRSSPWNRPMPKCDWYAFGKRYDDWWRTHQGLYKNRPRNYFEENVAN